MKRYLEALMCLSLIVVGAGIASAQTASAQTAGTSTSAANMAAQAAPADSATGGEELVIADFNAGEKPNNIGGDFGGWDKDPNDETQSCEVTFEADDALGDAMGYSLRMNYDVDSPNPAYNGFWMKLNNLDASAYNTISFYVRGTAEAPFTKRIKIEIKDTTMKPAPYIVAGITDQWQKFSIPFEKFKKIKSWDSLTEFVVVFDDINSNPKSGTILIDQVALSKE